MRKVVTLKSALRQLDTLIAASEDIGVMKDGAQPDDWYSVVTRYERANRAVVANLKQLYAERSPK